MQQFYMQQENSKETLTFQLSQPLTFYNILSIASSITFLLFKGVQYGLHLIGGGGVSPVLIFI